ncbi:hypothetical protein SARC_02509 [Sphaeroforma arctica JP610]|uniref:TFIIS N-terminal domain-containing protein n=1 Tax=Sphaeroforma arctica JP610 TaxID=667725 RepID=A0A0L0G8F8_9EUKA|nr:hypothetical protein SARC_02509 [Sphaeroforma arctica JP610]KNC85285.1 hypothetical protein SARC_02509 [Sphaeroforma arctica JP610]|eukprot:XP_014159187.1 hypothetical protein SARC_02509 [Sphaeroforma arctica JP610]
MEGPANVDTVRKWSQEIDRMINSSIDEGRVQAILNGLLKGSLSYTILKDSDIGRKVNMLRREHLESFPELKQGARELIKLFKNIMAQGKSASAAATAKAKQPVPPSSLTMICKKTGTSSGKTDKGSVSIPVNNSNSKQINQPTSVNSVPKMKLKIAIKSPPTSTSNTQVRPLVVENKQDTIQIVSYPKVKSTQGMNPSRSPAVNATSSHAEGKSQGHGHGDSTRSGVVDHQRRNGSKDVQRKRQPDPKSSGELDLFTRKKAPRIQLKSAHKDGYSAGHRTPLSNTSQQHRSPQPHARSPQPHARSPQPPPKSPQKLSRSPHPTFRSPRPTVKSPNPTSRSPHPTSRSPHPTSRSPQKQSQVQRQPLRSPQPPPKPSQPQPRLPQPQLGGGRDRLQINRPPTSQHPQKREASEAPLESQPVLKKPQIAKAKPAPLFNSGSKHVNQRVRRENAEDEARRRQAQQRKVDAAKNSDRFYNEYQHTETEKLEQERIKQLKLNPPPDMETKQEIKTTGNVSAEVQDATVRASTPAGPQKPPKPSPEDLLPKLRIPERHPANARLANPKNLVSTVHAAYNVNRRWKGVDGDVGSDGTWRKYSQTQAISVAPGHHMVVAPYSTPFSRER